jgi:hypothetical protein
MKESAAKRPRRLSPPLRRALLTATGVTLGLGSNSRR